MSTRSELKENMLAAKLEVLVAWVMANRGPVITGAGVAIAVVLIGSVFVLRNREKRDSDLTRLMLGKELVSQRAYDRAAASLADLRPSLTNHNLIAQSAYFQGLAALGQKNFAEAQAFFQEAVDHSAGSPLKPLALSNKGFAEEEKKDFEAAAQTCRQFMAEFDTHFLAARVQLSLGRTLAAAGKIEEAKAALVHLIDLYPTSQWAENARSIMDKLKIR